MTIVNYDTPSNLYTIISETQVSKAEVYKIFMALTEFGVMVLTKEGNTASALY